MADYLSIENDLFYRLLVQFSNEAAADDSRKKSYAIMEYIIGIKVEVGFELTLNMQTMENAQLKKVSVAGRMMMMMMMMKLSSRIVLCLLIVSILAISLTVGAQPSEGVSKGRLLYSENFSTSKFSVYDGELGDNFSRYFEDGRYHMEVVPLNYWRRTSAGAEYNNTIIEVEATQESGPNDNVYGIIFRKVDWNNYYQFIISGDGYYQIGKVRSNSWEFSSPWKKSSAIHTGDATNLIRVVCNGDKFSFYVNDIKVDDYTDGSFGSGMIGLVAGTEYSKGPVVIGFDNLSVWEIAK